jgi:hypothetical protein
MPVHRRRSLSQARLWQLLSPLWALLAAASVTQV